MQKAPVAVHHRSACSGVKALRNTSAAKRQAAKPWLAFRSLDPFRALREPDRRRRDEERPFRSEQRTATNQNDYLTGKAPYKSCKPVVPQQLGRRDATLIGARQLKQPAPAMGSPPDNAAEPGAGADAASQMDSGEQPECPRSDHHRPRRAGQADRAGLHEGRRADQANQQRARPDAARGPAAAQARREPALGPRNDRRNC